MNKKSGISLVVLVVTIIVLLIISSSVLYISADASNNAKLMSLASDLQQVEDLITEYYLTNNELPIVNEAIYDEATLVSSIEKGQNDLLKEITMNGDKDCLFLKVDLSKLNIDSTSRGLQQNGDESDIFVISQNTFNVYYLRGQKVGKKYYFSLTEELTKKTKITDTTSTEYSLVEIVNTTGTITLQKSESEWTNKLTINVTSDLAEGETLKYYISGQDITSNVTDNKINVSDILLSNATLKNTFYANDNNKTVTVEKYKNDEIITEKTISVSNLDILTGTTITDGNISYTKYTNYIMAKIEGYSDLGGSGLKEVRMVYTTKLDSDKNEIPYYDDLPDEITKEYVYNSGVKNGSTSYKLPSDVVQYSIVFVDNAGNISDVLNATTVVSEVAVTS